MMGSAPGYLFHTTFETYGCPMRLIPRRTTLYLQWRFPDRPIPLCILLLHSFVIFVISYWIFAFFYCIHLVYPIEYLHSSITFFWSILLDIRYTFSFLLIKFFYCTLNNIYLHSFVWKIIQESDYRFLFFYSNFVNLIIILTLFNNLLCL